MAAATPKFKLNKSEFDRAIKAYLPLSKSVPRVVVNRKAFYIARRACLETPKAKGSKIHRDLEKKIVTQSNIVGQKVRFLKSGRMKRGALIYEHVMAPLIALIVNARKGRSGEKGLYGMDMARASDALEAARMKSIAFLKSGWLPAIRKLASLVGSTRGAPRQDRSAEQVGQSKGDASPARDAAFKVKATITNAAGSNRKNNDALMRFGGPALQRAFDAETASTMEETAKRLKEAALKAGIKAH